MKGLPRTSQSPDSPRSRQSDLRLVTLSISYLAFLRTYTTLVPFKKLPRALETVGYRRTRRLIDILATGGQKETAHDL